MASLLEKILPSKEEAKPTACSVKANLSENEKMTASVWHAKEKIVAEQVPKPLVTDPQDAIIRVTSTTICGSDLHMYYNQVPGVKPMRSGDIIGHECMGIVESVGPEVKELKPGDRVVVSAVIADGTCWYCKQGLFSACDGTNPSVQMEKLYGQKLAGILGYSHLTGAYDGGQADFVRVPFSDVNCLKVPDSLTDEQVLFLSDIVCTGYHGTELSDVQPGDTVVVWGCGPVGLMAQKWSLFKGAKRVIAIDRVPYRLEVAKKMGCEVINVDEVSSVVDTLTEMVPGGADVGIECVGFRFPVSLVHKVERALGFETDSLDIIDQMVKSVRKFGRIALIGDYFGYGNHFPIGALMEKGISIRGSQVLVQRYWKKLLGHIEAGEFDPTFVITHHLPLSQIDRGYDMFANMKDNALKIILKPDSGRR